MYLSKKKSVFCLSIQFLFILVTRQVLESYLQYTSCVQLYSFYLFCTFYLCYPLLLAKNVKNLWNPILCVTSLSLQIKYPKFYKTIFLQIFNNDCFIVNIINIL